MSDRFSNNEISCSGKRERDREEEKIKRMMRGRIEISDSLHF